VDNIAVHLLSDRVGVITMLTRCGVPAAPAAAHRAAGIQIVCRNFTVLLPQDEFSFYSYWSQVGGGGQLSQQRLLSLHPLHHQQSRSSNVSLVLDSLAPVATLNELVHGIVAHLPHTAMLCNADAELRKC
jgi:hypothetical protein